MKGKLQNYCNERGITMEQLAEMSGVSYPMICNINQGANTTVDVINKIYTATKKRFKVGLIAEQYLNIYVDKSQVQ
jgi:transcriptional regulator with XRE-family HTH domain